MSHFAFEDLEVWKRATEFANLVIDSIELLDSNRKHFRLVEQLEAAAASIAMNIAEGKGRFSKKEFVQFLYIARGSLFETITLLEIFRQRKWISEDEFARLKDEGDEIGKMISGLINSIRGRS